MDNPSGNDKDDSQVSEVGSMDEGEADTPVVDGDATSGYPDSESGDAQEPDEAGPNANPHKDQDTH